MNYLSNGHPGEAGLNVPDFRFIVLHISFSIIFRMMLGGFGIKGIISWSTADSLNIYTKEFPQKNKSLETHKYDSVFDCIFF